MGKDSRKVTLVLLDGDGRVMRHVFFDLDEDTELAPYVMFKFFVKDKLKLKRRPLRSIKYRTVGKRVGVDLRDLVTYIWSKVNKISDVVYYLQHNKVKFYGSCDGAAVYEIKNFLFIITDQHFEIVGEL